MIVIATNFNDDNASAPADFSGQGNTATSTTNLSIVNGETGKAGDFSGNTEVDLPHPSEIENTDKITIFVKFKIDSSTGSDQFIAQSIGDWKIRYENSSGDLKVDISTGNGSVTLSHSINTGTWYSILAKYNGSDATLFVDNDQKDTASITGDLGSSSNISLGYEDAPTHQKFLDGKIEDFRVYDKSVGSESIKALFASDAGKKITTDREHSLQTGDIVRGDPEGNDAKGVVAWKKDNTTLFLLPSGKAFGSDEPFVRVGNVFDSNRQDYVSMRETDSKIAIYDGIASTSDIDSAAKEKVSMDKSGDIKSNKNDSGSLTIADDSVKSITPNRNSGTITVWHLNGNGNVGIILFEVINGDVRQVEELKKTTLFRQVRGMPREQLDRTMF